MACETRPPDGGFIQLQTLDHCPHRTIEDMNSFSHPARQFDIPVFVSRHNVVSVFLLD
jgi:hypothetical protein